jgi:hypothetical protein
MADAPQSSTRQDLFTENDPNIIRQGIKGYGVYSGLAPTAGAGLNIAIAAGSAYFDTVKVTKATSTNVLIATGVTNPRRDIIVMDSAGTISVVQGTAAAVTVSGTDTKFQTFTPYPPPCPANSILIAEIYVAVGAASFAASDILDKRVLLNTNIVRTSEKIVLTTGVNVEFYAPDGTTMLMKLDADGNLYIKGVVQQL